MILNAPELHQRVDQCMQFEQHQLRRRIKSVAGRSSDDPDLQTLLQRIDNSAAQRAARKANRPSPRYPDALPVVQQRQQILDALGKHQVVIVCGETGSGKTTQLPKMCLELGRGIAGYIGHTQPRRIAARSVAARIASELNSTVGDAVWLKFKPIRSLINMTR